MQKTLEKSVKIQGIGLHSGCNSTLVLHPASADSGIVFKRTDLPNIPIFLAKYNHVVDTRNCTCLGDANGQVVSTIEHIMATLYALQIDNALLELNNHEVPIMDGSAILFYEQLKKEKLSYLGDKNKYLKVKKEVKFTDKEGNYICLSPADELRIKFTIDFPSKIVGHQEFDSVITEDIFAAELAPARTFCEKYQVDYLRSIGLIKGGSLDNAIVLDGETILNDGGFRLSDECVKHKVLDCIGDMYTSGYRILANIEAYHTGHYHNNEVLKMLFSDEHNYDIIEE